MTISVITVNWNTGPLLRRCLEAERIALGAIPSETIVVDNCSRDGSDRIVELEFPEVRLIRAPTNLGFGRANNLAARQAAGDFLLFLNPDAILEPDAVSVLLDYATSNPDAGILGAHVLTPSDSVQLDSCGYFFSFGHWLASLLYIDRLLPAASYFQALRIKRSGMVDWVSGVCLMIRTSLFRSLGGFDPGIFAYYEDMDLCHRAFDLGRPTHIVLEAKLTHYRGTGFRHQGSTQIRSHQQGELLYIRRNWSGGGIASYVAVRSLQCLRRWCWETLRDNREGQQTQRQLLAAVTGTGPGSVHRRSEYRY